MSLYNSAMLKGLSWFPLVAALLTGAPVSAQVGSSPQPPAAAKDEVTINGSATPLPKLPPDQFTDCMRRTQTSASGYDPVQGDVCNAQLSRQKHVVMVACVNQRGDIAPPRVIQACTELLDHNFFEGRDRFPLFANRARARFAQGEHAQALEDYAEAIKLAPNKSKGDLCYARGLVYAAQSNFDAALQDFNTAITISPKSVPALRQRARIYQHQDNFSSSLQDYTQAIHLEPKDARLWSERGYVSLREHDFQSALQDEAQAISLDPKLAWAFFLRGTASGNLGDSGNASSDIKTAVGLDPSLAQYVIIKDKNVSLLLPPPPAAG